MAEDAKEVGRTIGRGRRESAPWYAVHSVLLVCAIFAAFVAGIALLAFYLAK